jgi:hypothetical protein
MASKTTRIATNSAKQSARKGESKRARYRTWLLSLIHGPTPGLPENLAQAINQRAGYRAGERWLQATGIDRDGPRQGSAQPTRQLPRWRDLPPFV